MNEILWHCDNCVADFEGTDRTYICPRCKLRDIVEVYPINRTNEVKKSVALILSVHLDISEEGAEEIVNMLIEAVKYELNTAQ